jgi:hypothetical protein
VLQVSHEASDHQQIADAPGCGDSDVNVGRPGQIRPEPAADQGGEQPLGRARAGQRQLSARQLHEQHRRGPGAVVTLRLPQQRYDALQTALEGTHVSEIPGGE